MAATSGVWGIDLGQCALKALRCEYDAASKSLVATAFDYIEYPKILSQPDANRQELVREAMTQFLGRNVLRGDRVAISVAGQNGLSRFFEPPPVDLKKLPEIVKFEAKQQIPFPLDEVIWDYQLMGGANEVDGFLMEAEVGLFAMKRDQVYESMQPFRTADVQVELIQLAPLCAYNFVAYSLLTEVEGDLYDPDNPPESIVIVSMGTDTTDLVITNGFRVWQRNIPIGGNHFTKQLTKELKLTFTKAEHLKRHVREAEDAKAVIQAMRPVFNDLLTEVQRSIGFFQNIDRKADIGSIVMLGNAVRLPGLQQYLAKNLGYKLHDITPESISARLSGQSVLAAPQFKENLHAFGVCYGLCVQALKKAKLDTNLLPREIVTERIIRAKKPWALATAAALMLAFAVNFFFEYRDWYKVHLERDFGGLTWNKAMDAVKQVQAKSSSDDQQDALLNQRLDELVALGKELSGNSDRRLLWVELIKSINAALPNDGAMNEIPDPRAVPITQRQDIHIEYIESQYFPDPPGLQAWFNETVKYKYMLELARVQEPGGNPLADPNAAIPGALPTVPPPAAAVAPGGAVAPAAPAAVGPPAAGPPLAAPPLGVPPLAAPTLEIPPLAAPETGAPTPTPQPTPSAVPAPAAPRPVAPAAPAAPPAGAGAVLPAGAAPGAVPAPVEPVVDAAAQAEIAEAGLNPESITGPQGPGWVIEVRGHHYFNEDTSTWGGTHVRNSFLKNLREQKIALPMGPGQPPMEFTMEELGISYPIIAVEYKIDQNFQIQNPYYVPTPGAVIPGQDPNLAAGYGPLALGPGPGLTPPGAAKPKPEEPASPPEPPFFRAPKYVFVVQFCWQEVQLTERLRRRDELLRQQQEQFAQPPVEGEPGAAPTAPDFPPTGGVATTNVGG